MAASSLQRALIDRVGAFAVAFGVVALAAPGRARAEERFDHRGAVGLLIGGGLEYKEGVTVDRVRDSGLRFPVELGATYAIDYDGNELMLLGRASLGPRVDTALMGGYRGYFGKERAKTFFDLGLAVHPTPAFDVGPRIGFGFQYEFLSVLGLYASAAAQLGGGNGFRFSVEATAGLQFRSYLLE